MVGWWWLCTADRRRTTVKLHATAAGIVNIAMEHADVGNPRPASRFERWGLGLADRKGMGMS